MQQMVHGTETSPAPGKGGNAPEEASPPESLAEQTSPDRVSPGRPRGSETSPSPGSGGYVTQKPSPVEPVTQQTSPDRVPSPPPPPVTVLPPRIEHLTPDRGPVGTEIRLQGQGFGPVQRARRVFLIAAGGAHALQVRAWSDREIQVVLPPGPVPGTYRVALAEGTRWVSNLDRVFTVSAPPRTDRVGVLSPAPTKVIPPLPPVKR
jgi:hypothetical protein